MIKVTIVEPANIIITNRNIRLIKKVLRQDHYFSTRLPYADKRIREIWMNMVNTRYNTTEDMIDILQQLEGRTKLQFYKSLSNFYDEMKHINFQTQEDSFSKNAQGISKNYHEVLMLVNFLPTQPSVKNTNNNYYDLFYTVIKNRDEKDNNENDYTNFNDFITPNPYFGIKLVKHY